MKAGKYTVVFMAILAILLFVKSDTRGAKQKKVDHIFLAGEVNEDMAGTVISQIDGTDADSILLEFDSPGGTVSSAFKIIKSIERAKVPIVCVVDSNAESAAFYILQTCHYRIMTKRSKIMAHEPSLAGEVSHAQPQQWANIAAMLSAEANAMAEWCGRRLKGGVAEYKRQTRGGRDWWMNWREALAAGAIDAAIDTPEQIIPAMAAL